MSTFLQSQGAARGGAHFGDPTDEFRLKQTTEQMQLEINTYRGVTVDKNKYGGKINRKEPNNELTPC